MQRKVYSESGSLFATGLIKGLAYCGPNDKIGKRAEKTITFSGDVLVRPDEMEENHERHKKDN